MSPKLFTECYDKFQLYELVFAYTPKIELTAVWTIRARETWLQLAPITHARL